MFQFISFAELVDKNLSPKERLMRNKEKNPHKKTRIADLEEKDIMKKITEKNEIDTEELTYEEAQSRYGLVFNDVDMVCLYLRFYCAIVSYTSLIF